MSDGGRSADAPAGRGFTLPAWAQRLAASPGQVAAALALLTLALGLIGALTALTQGVWLDEFWTLASGERGMTLAEFGAVMARDVHPPLHYGMIFVAQAVGIESLAALRALNLLGAPLVAWACWFAWRRGAVSSAQVWTLVALSASSALFLNYVAELRAYFLVFSSSVALTLFWRVLARDAAERRAWSWDALLGWFVCLALIVNLHYFATLLGGVLTLALMALRRDRAVVPLGVLSALAAAPAIVMALIQATATDAGIVQWVQTGRIDAAFVMIDTAWAAAAYNAPAVGLAIVAALIALEQGKIHREMTDELALVAAVAAYFAVLLAVNAVRPIVVDRYLTAVGGPVIVGLALLAGGARTPRWGAAAVCAFALLAQARNLYSDAYRHDGWSTSAAAVAELADACDGGRVYIDPEGDTPDIRMFSTTRRYGLRYYAERMGLAVEEARPGDALPAPGACPTLIWLEHVDPADTMTGRGFLDMLDLTIEGEAELLEVGSGAVVVVR